MKKTLLVIALAVVASAAALVVGPPPSGAQEGPPKFRQTENAVPDQYIVVLRDDTEASLVEATSESLAQAYGGQVRYTYEYALKGFSVTMSEKDAMALSEDSQVEFVEENGMASLNTTQFNPPWGLDRIDQRFRPLTNSYTYDNTGTAVYAYIIDTGIRATHADFGGRAVAAADYAVEPPPWEPGGCSVLRPIICAAGVTPPPPETATENSDCHGHGTHVAGTVGGTIYGVAKNVRLLGVRVLGCGGSGTWDGVIAGVNWVTAHHQINGGPAVANMSLGGGAISSVDLAVRNSINSGITYAVAAGNSNANASGFSPARVSEALTVGATTINDVRGHLNGSFFSNYGSLVDLHAPGVDVTSAWITNDTATNTISGTSMASPHVAGVAAQYLQTYRTASPPVVHADLVNNSTAGVITSLPAGTPNRLLYSLFIPPDAAPQPTHTDFDGDVRADLAVWRPGDNHWYVRNSSNGGSSAVPWGSSAAGDKIVPGDYDGDGRADRAVWRPTDGTWYVLSNFSGRPNYYQWGASGDIPVPADYDGDGRTDRAVWRPSNGVWYIINSSTGSPRYETFGLGSLGDKPVAADYDGDGKADVAVWRAPEGQWYILNSSTGALTVRQWGNANDNDVLVPSDYDGDGRTDLAVWRPGNGTWYIIESTTNNERHVPWGSPGDIPAPADYDADGETDVATFRPSTGIWNLILSATDTMHYPQWGASGDVPVPSAYNRY